MIKFEGEYKKYNTSEEEMISYLNDAYNRAINYFSYFVSRYDLDPNLFEHLYNIDLVIDYSNEDACAYYVPRGDNLEIHVFSSYIDRLYTKNKDKDLDYLASTLLHEMLHVNRTVILKNSIQCSEYIDSYDKIFDYSSFEYLLDNSFNNNTYYDNPNYVILKKTNNETWIYNKNNNMFEIYDGKLFLEKPKKYSYYYFYLNKPAVISDYDLKYNYDELNNKNKDIIIDDIIKQLGIEECMTECMSAIIVYANKNKNLDIKDIVNLAFSNCKVQLLKIGFRLFYDDNVIPWFLTSCYMDEYTNYLEKIYKNYDEILDYFDLLYYEKIRYGLITSKDKAIKLEFLLNKNNGN